MDLFASSDNAHCKKFYSLRWCRDTAWVNVFSFPWTGDGNLLVRYDLHGPWPGSKGSNRAISGSRRFLFILCGSPPLGGTLSLPMWFPSGNPNLFIRETARVARSCPQLIAFGHPGLLDITVQDWIYESLYRPHPTGIPQEST